MCIAGVGAGVKSSFTVLSRGLLLLFLPLIFLSSFSVLPLFTASLLLIISHRDAVRNVIYYSVANSTINDVKNNVKYDFGNKNNLIS